MIVAHYFTIAIERVAILNNGQMLRHYLRAAYLCIHRDSFDYTGSQPRTRRLWRGIIFMRFTNVAFSEN